MKIARLMTLMVSIAVAVPGQKTPVRKQPDVEVLELKAKHTQRQLALDGRVRVGAARSIKGLLIAFDFLSDDGVVLATEKTRVDEDVLAPGAESPIHADTDNLPRAVRVRVRAADFRQRELAVGNAGPFTIE
ncbi:MAG: hypothetical protein ABSH45_04115 [Bryobacteraceae bacterium]|jgi:hypothetical protein